MELEGAAALVTGAARRVGRAIALELARAGCQVCIHYNRSHQAARDVAQEITDLGGRSHVIQADLNDPACWASLVGSAHEALGAIDVLVNNAALFETTTGSNFDARRWEEMFRVNVTAVAALCHFAADALSAGPGGKIVNVTDIAADRPWPSYSAYCASKAATANLTKSFAIALAPLVQVNAVAPGIAVFPDHYTPQRRDALVSRVPLGRAGTPQDVANAVRYLCADADYVTGAVINVDGGRSINQKE